MFADLLPFLLMVRLNLLWLCLNNTESCQRRRVSNLKPPLLP